VTTQSSHRRLSTRVTHRIGAGASLVALLVAVLWLAPLATGCGQTPAVSTSASPATNTTTGPSDTSTTAADRLSSPLAGWWFFSDASGGLMIEPGARVLFIDPD
jgi:hypothetical protein